MISYRVELSIGQDKYGYCTRAENCRQAVGKFLLAVRDADLFTSDIISLWQEIIADAIIDPDEDILVYDSENIKLESSRNLTIVPDKPGDDYEDSIKYTHMNLPKHLSNFLDEVDVEWVLFQRYDYIEQNGFYLDEDDERVIGSYDKQKFYYPDAAAEYIYKRSLEEEIGLTLVQIEAVIKAAIEYDMATTQPPEEEIINLNAIDISSISPN